ncbi:hypothetical protein [Halomonas caseinilytica]|uniref:hypothetical protein n=1 Tax=Halomonas caseinilytica TaxID=438744 RepID=UPI0007E59BDC|nr:hypothetical protein [Halomonas caseinilytica]SEN20670.1 hypothetical protein SAMN04487952_111104 [Halomonas caseinilytica]
MAQYREEDLRRIRRLLAQGFISIRRRRPRESEHIDYDLCFMGQQIAGHKQLNSLQLEVDEALNPIDAALLVGSGPAITSIYWRPHAPSSVGGAITARDED